jgi:hypothetical protein
MCHVTARDDDFVMVLASANELKKGVRRHQLSIKGNATPVAMPPYVRDKRNVVDLASSSRRSKYSCYRGSRKQMLPS